jgi:hypothetical protein
MVLATAFLALSAGTALGKCNNLPKSPVAAEGEVSTTMNVSTGTLCPVTLRPRRGETFSGASISKEPANGTVIVRRADRVSYRSKRGYSGPDAFSFTVKSILDNKPAQVTVNVAVTVDRSFPRVRRTLGL